LDIKYDLDDYRILPEARFELDRLVRYLNDNLMDRVELGSHTDSRGSTNYNQTLSENRALSAVDYIISKGISRDRILAKGYGETRLLNACRDGVTCSEEDHRINRRTEAVLLCN
ncbi:MAG: OmpA family protein, partial [Bacteroidota bacterium]